MHIEADYLRYRDPRYVHDVAAVKLSDRGGLVCLRYELFHVGAGDIPQPHRLHEGETQLEHLGSQAEATVRRADVTELGQGDQDPVSGGAGELGAACQCGEGHRRLWWLEGFDHVEPSGQRLDEIRRAGSSCQGTLPD